MIMTNENSITRQDLEQALKAAIAAGQLAVKRDTADAYKDTERRLRAYPVLLCKMEEDKERLKELETMGPRARSRDITRFSKGGLRLSAEEIQEALKKDLEADIAATEYEIDCINRALGIIANDDYYQTVPAKYFDGMTDQDAADTLHCDCSTVRRNRSRLVKTIAVKLYGVHAI